MARKVSTMGKRDKYKEKYSPTFQKFEQDLESLKYDSDEMAKAVFNRLIPGPLWHLNTVELAKAKAKLTELIKHIEGTIERAEELAEILKKEEYSMLMTQEKVKKLNIMNYPDFTCRPYGENLMITRRKTEENSHGWSPWL